MARRVVVTGVAGGLGRAIAECFKRDGWEVGGTDRREPAAGVRLDAFVAADLLDTGATTTAIEQLGRDGIDALVNNAAIQPLGSLTETSANDWQETLTINVQAPAATIRAAHPLLRQRSGSIVNITSVHALATSPGRAAYVASKGALMSLTRAAALELAGDGIRVNAVIPGAVETEMLRQVVGGNDSAIADVAASTPLGRIGEPLEIAEAVMFLADSQRSSFVTGQGLVVDGGVLARLASE